MSISVIIPYFNASATIKNCVESVVVQTHAVLEIIIVDDASREKDRQYLQEIVHDYPILRIIVSEKNRGAAHARNVGISASHGEWIAFLDADDVWLPNKIQTVSRYFERFDFISHDYAEEAPRGDHHEVTETQYTYSDFLIKNRISTPTVMLRKSKYIPFNSQYRYAEDYEAWLNYFASNITCIHLRVTLAHGFKRSFGVSGLSGNLRAMYLSEIKILSQQRNYKRISMSLCLILQLLWFLKFVVRLIKVKKRQTRHA